MAYKPPVPEKPYFPALGWNPEAGLAISADECVDTENLRFTKKEIFTRDGRRAIGKNNPGVILNTFLYKKPDGTKKTFGFSADNVYEFDAGSDRWQYAKKYVVLDACELVTNFGTGLASVAVSTSCFLGTYAMHAQATGDIADTTVILDKDGASAMTWNASTYTKISFWYYHTGTATVPVKVKFYSDDAKTTLVQSMDVNLLASTRGEYQEARCTMTTPAGFSAIKSFEIVADGAVTVATTLDFYFDNICAITPLANEVTFWHCTRFVDDGEGATVIAAGSSPPQIDAAESDGGTRALLFYDVSAGYFDDLTTFELVAIGDEYTNVTCPATATTVTGGPLAHDSGDAGFQEIYQGTFSLYTLEYGTLATASVVLSGVNSGSANGFFLVPTDTTKVKGGANSWIEKDGTNWSLEFLTDEYSGLKIYCQYTYKQTSTVKPRFVWSFHNRLIMGNVYEGSTYYPWRVHWSAIGEMDFITYIDYADIIDNDVSPITGGAVLGYYLNIYKADSIAKLSYVGGTAVFLANTVWMEGTWAGRTVVSFQNRHYLLAKDDVVMWDGMAIRSISKSIGMQDSQHRVRDHIFTNLNQNKIGNCFANFYPIHKEFWLWIVGAGETYPTQVYVYNILNDVWYYFKHTACISAGEAFVDSNPTIDSLIGSIDDQNWRLDAASTEGVLNATIVTPAIGNVDVIDDTSSSDGGYYQFDETWVSGSAIAWKIITRDFIYGDVPQQDRTERVDFEALGETCNIAYCSYYRTNPASFLLSTTITLDVEFLELHYFPDAVGEHIRFLLSGTGSFRLRWIQPFAVINELVND